MKIYFFKRKQEKEKYSPLEFLLPLIMFLHSLPDKAIKNLLRLQKFLYLFGELRKLGLLLFR